MLGLETVFNDWLDLKKTKLISNPLSSIFKSAVKYLMQTKYFDKKSDFQESSVLLSKKVKELMFRTKRLLVKS